MAYRVYLTSTGFKGWQEFGIDYETREGAKAAADVYRDKWPNHRYVVRHVKVGRQPRKLSMDGYIWRSILDESKS